MNTCLGEGLRWRHERLVICVLGGTGVGTPALIDAVAKAVQARRLPPIELRLHGREMTRARGLIRYSSLVSADVGVEGNPKVLLREAPAIEEGLLGSHVVLCLVRPGGMSERADDERMALDEGLPGDEGIGPSGLASFLRGRSLLEKLQRAWRRHAPLAPFLQLTSPLGLATAYVARDGGTVLGVCEVPRTTSRLVRSVAEPVLGPLSHAHFGMNHCAWLYGFIDREGTDRTADVILICGEKGLLPVPTVQALTEGAVPLPHLRMLYRTEEVVEEQRAVPTTRGEELLRWCSALHDAYCARDGIDVGRVAALLRQRRMDWHLEAVVPALEAWCGEAPARLTLNAVSVAHGVAVETTCVFGNDCLTPVEQAPLPPRPAALFGQLVRYECAALALSEEPEASDIAQVIGLHPMVPNSATAERLGQRIAERLAWRW